MTSIIFRCILLLMLTVTSLSTLWGQSIKVLERRIDSVVTNAIQQRAFPGCVVYAAHKGKPIFLKAYGYHTYDSLMTTQPSTIYDLASLTKVTAAGLCLMKLYEDGKIHLDNSLGTYVQGLNELIGQLTLRELLTHQSGLPPGLRFHERILAEEARWGRTPYGLRAQNRYEAMKGMLNELTTLGTKEYRYSDLFFLLVPELIKNVSGKTMEDYLMTHFYDPLGVHLTFNPTRHFSLDRIAPTEYDSIYHKHLIHGNVHDESAALLGGVSGNAGLFGNVQDLARVWQMLANRGTLDGQRYLRAKTIDLFTKTHFPNSDNHRGLIFDKRPNKYDSLKNQMSETTTMSGFGHTGFTGTMVWVDPEKDLLFVFLSNRVHPSRSPNLLADMRVRPLLHQYFLGYLE